MTSIATRTTTVSVILFLTLALPTLCTPIEVSDPSVSWAGLLQHISPYYIGSMPFGGFRVKIYEHITNNKSNEASTRKRYFYAPIALLDHMSAISIFNDVTNQEEVRFRIEFWNEKVDSEVANYLSKIVREQVETHQVEVLPFEKVILTDQDYRHSFFILPSTWSPINLQKSAWFTLICFELGDCPKLSETMRNNPQEFKNLQLHFSMQSQPSFKREIDIVAAGQMANKLLRRFPTEDTVFLIDKYEKRLLEEVTTATIMNYFNPRVSLKSKEDTYNIIKSLIVKPNQLNSTKESHSVFWPLVFWNNENYRPDKTSEVLNRVYEKMNAENKIKLSYMFTEGNKRDVDFASQIPSFFASLETELASVNIRLQHKEYLTNLYNENKDHVEWNGGKFVPKSQILNEINLMILRHDHHKHMKKFQNVNFVYSTSALSTPVNIDQHSDLTVTCKTKNLQNVSTNLTKDVNDLRIVGNASERQCHGILIVNSWNETKQLSEIDVSRLEKHHEPLTFENDPCGEEIVDCRAISCPYGFEICVSNSGFKECRCYEPCRGYSCPDETQCHAELVRDESDPKRSVTRVQLACRQSMPPRIVDCETRVAAEEGGVVVLRCEAVGSPKPTIYWRDGKEKTVHDEGKFKIEPNGFLQIISVHRSDAGMFTCIAHNGVGTSALKQTQLEVKFAPTTRAWVERSSYLVGSDIEIFCDVQGFPKPQVTWYKDDNEVVSSTDRVSINDNHTITIIGAESDDSGSYRCKAVNLIGDSTSVVSIHVDGKSRFCTNKYYWPEFQNGAGNVKWQFNCDFPGDDISNHDVRGEDCGELCIRTKSCNAFSYHHDKCYLKNVDFLDKKPAEGGVCGFLPWAIRSFAGDSGK